MRVSLCPADRAACGANRIVWPAQNAYQLGSTFAITYSLANVSQSDVLVIQRPMSRQLLPLIEGLQKTGVAIVVELDDDFSALGANNPAFFASHPRNNGDISFNLLKTFCKMADLVTCTTENLARVYAGHGRFQIIPNYVPAWYLDIEKPVNERVTVGWAGSLAYHHGDLDVCGLGVAEAVKATGARYLAIGDERQAEVLRLSEWEHQPPVPIEQYPHKLANLDIGLVPLAQTRFNKGKSALKLMEYASVGALPIVSPTPDNLRMVEQHGLIVGVAHKPKDWRRLVTYWATHHDEREAAAQHNRSVMRAECTYELNGHRWVAAWQQAIDNSRARRQAAA